MRAPAAAAARTALAATLALGALLGSPESVLGAVAVPKEAIATGAVVDGEPRVEVRLLADAEKLTPGETFRAGVLFNMDSGYHIYWRNPGDDMRPTQVQLGAAGATVGALEWPAPDTFPGSARDVATYGYEDEVLLFAPVRVAESPGASVTLTAAVEYIACKTTCTPGKATLTRTVAMGPEVVPAPSSVTDRFVHYAERVPHTAKTLGLTDELVLSQSAVRPGDRFRAALALVSCMAPPSAGQPCPALQLSETDLDAGVIVDAPEGLVLRPIGVRPHPTAFSGLLVDFEGRVAADAPARTELSVGAIVKLDRDTPGLAFTETRHVLAQAALGTAVTPNTHPWLAPQLPRVPEPRSAAVLPWWTLLGLALLGGMLLNLMPCVLPVLALKAVGVAMHAHDAQRETRAQGFAYAAGVIGSLLALGAVVVVLRAGGHAVGWGFQFQEPRFIAAVATVLVVFALSLLGVFEIHVGDGGVGGLALRAAGLRRSFFEGVLAVVVATPCSAPFLGSAIGFALTLPAPWVLATFATVGAGLAAPYVAMTLWPAWARFVPRPGAWMVTLRQGLGFALLGTAVWLTWVVGRMAGVDGMAGLLVFFVAVAIATWVVGLTQAASTSRTRRWAWRGLAALLLLLVGQRTLQLPAASQCEPLADASARWLPYDGHAVNAQRGAGRTVLVDFTADWCITCKVNERAVLASAHVLETIDRHGVVLFRADWTRGDTAITQELARHGRAGVPLYLVFGPGTGDAPIVLPEVLTADLVVEALERASTPPS